MENVIVPTWDLFIIIFGIMIMAYSFIIGKETTIKLIIATYISLLASDGLVAAAYTYLFSESQLADNLPILAVDSKELIIAKVVAFLAFIVLLATKGGFEAPEHESAGIVRGLYLGIFSILSAALIVSGILVFLSGASFIQAFLQTEAAQPSQVSLLIYDTSLIAKYLIDYAPLTFSFPAIALILASLGEDED